MGELDVAKLLSVTEAVAVIDATAVAPRVARVPLGEAAGLRLAQDVVADRDYPPFAKSLMDGYAVRAADVSGASAARPIDLRVVGEVAAGAEPTRAVTAGEAVAIMTGAPLPAGADGVVPVEDVHKLDGADGQRRVRVLRADAPGRYVAARGSDCAADRVVIRRGTRLGPAHLAVAASVGAASVDVFGAPHVAVLGTGDELVPVEQTPGPAQIRNSNNVMLVALLRRLGCDVQDLGTAPDRPDAIRDKIMDGLRHDALFVTGGMSMGEYDYVPRILHEVGVDLRVTKLRIKPGKPFVFGMSERSEVRGQRSGSDAGPVRSFVFGLPGNPVSAFVCTLRLASRLLERLAGGQPPAGLAAAKLSAPVTANGSREFYQPGILYDGTIQPLVWKGSADLFTLAAANVLIVRPENAPALAAGDAVPFVEIP